MDALEGLDGFIYIETEEELVELINMSYGNVINKIKNDSIAEGFNFDGNEYL